MARSPDDLLEGPNPFDPPWIHFYGMVFGLAILVLILALGITIRLATADTLPRFAKLTAIFAVDLGAIAAIVVVLGWLPGLTPTH